MLDVLLNHRIVDPYCGHEIASGPDAVGSVEDLLEERELLLEVASGVGFQDGNHFSNGEFWRNPEHEMDVVFVVVHLLYFNLGIELVQLLECLLHVRKNTFVEDSATVLRDEDEVVDAVIDTIVLTLVVHALPILPGKTPDRLHPPPYGGGFAAEL